MSHVTVWVVIAILIGFRTWVAVALFAVASINNFRLRIYSDHRDVWRALGGSDDFEMGSGRKDSAFYYCIFRRYLSLGDPELTRLGNRAVLALAIQAVCFFAALSLWIRGNWT